MSTILKALQELERRDTLLGQPTPSWTDRNRRLRWGAVGLALLALLGGALGVTFLIRAGAARPSASQPTLSTVRQSQAAPQETVSQQAAPRQHLPAPPRTSPASNDLPQGRVEKRLPPAPPRTAQLVPPSGRAATRQAAPQRERRRRATAREDLPVPGLRVQSCSYSQVVGESTVTLETASARNVTLHEGESADGVEVQLIGPNTVYLRQGGNVFAVNVGP